MDQGLQILKEASKTLKRFTDLKRSGFFLIVFLICFVLVAILGILGFGEVILYIFITAFISFILGFIFMVKHIISSEKKEAAFIELLVKHLWQPILTRDTLSYDYDYVIQTNKLSNDYIIQHPLISSRASRILPHRMVCMHYGIIQDRATDKIHPQPRISEDLLLKPILILKVCFM